MNTQIYNTIKFYESTQDIGDLEPYANISSHELTATIRRFVLIATLIATHPNFTEIFGEASRAPIRIATELRTAVQSSLRAGIYPNVILPKPKFSVAMSLRGITCALEPEIHEIIARENQRWEEDFPV